MLKLKFTLISPFALPASILLHFSLLPAPIEKKKLKREVKFKKRIKELRITE